MEAFAYTARYDAAISRWFAEREEDFPAMHPRRLREGARPLLRREPAPARGLLRAGRRAHAPALDGVEAPRQGAVVQQPARPRLRHAGWSSEFEVPAAAIIKHNNPCGVAVGGDGRGGVRQGARDRPAERLRRRHVLQPPRRPGAGGEAERDVRGARVRARLRRGRARDPQAEAEHPDPRGPGAPPDAGHRAGPQARARRPARPGPRRTTSSRARRCRSSPSASRPRQEWGELAVRLAGLQARALERDRAREGPRHRSASAPGR